MAALASRGVEVLPAGRSEWDRQPGAYLQNLDLSGPVEVPYSLDATFGFLDLADLGEAAAIVLTEPGHEGATYELASRTATVHELADEAGVSAEQVPDPGAHPWLSDMFAYYDAHGLPAGTRVLRSLLAVEGSGNVLRQP